MCVCVLVFACGVSGGGWGGGSVFVRVSVVGVFSSVHNAISALGKANFHPLHPVSQDVFPGLPLTQFSCSPA